MKKFSFVVSLVLAFALSVWAQTPSSNDTQSGSGSSASQSSQSGTGSMGSQGTMSSPSTSSQTSGSQGSAGQGNMGTAEQGKSGKEHKLKGCLESEGGSYVLREKNGKEIPLTGSADMSQYANHEVEIRGDWATGAASPASSTSDMSKSAGSSEKQFTVEKVDSLSDTCKGAKKADKDKGATNNANPSSPQQ
jgi:hypothetical protein